MAKVQVLDIAGVGFGPFALALDADVGDVVEFCYGVNVASPVELLVAEYEFAARVGVFAFDVLDGCGVGAWIEVAAADQAGACASIG